MLCDITCGHKNGNTVQRWVKAADKRTREWRWRTGEGTRDCCELQDHLKKWETTRQTLTGNSSVQHWHCRLTAGHLSVIHTVCEVHFTLFPVKGSVRRSEKEGGENLIIKKTNNEMGRLTQSATTHRIGINRRREREKAELNVSQA